MTEGISTWVGVYEVTEGHTVGTHICEEIWWWVLISFTSIPGHHEPTSYDLCVLGVCGVMLCPSPPRPPPPPPPLCCVLCCMLVAVRNPLKGLSTREPHLFIPKGGRRGRRREGGRGLGRGLGRRGCTHLVAFYPTGLLQHGN